MRFVDPIVFYDPDNAVKLLGPIALGATELVPI